MDQNITQEKERYILYVEDDDDDSNIVCSVIKEGTSNLNVVVIENGTSAINFLNSLEGRLLPCLIILDINMPGMDGFEVLKRIKKTEYLSSLPIVIYSSSHNPNDKLKAMKLGADAFISKPLSLKEVRQVIAELVPYC